MLIYTYDGTFEGFLTVVALAREKREIPDSIIHTPSVQGGLFDHVVPVGTDYELASAVSDEIVRALSTHSFRNVLHAFHSEAERVETALFRYLHLGWRIGKRIDSMLAHELVLPVRTLAQKVRTEAHRIKGFVRFEQVSGGFYYARVEPGHHVLPLIAPHFAARFADQHWVIHDLRRGKGIVHDAVRREWAAVNLDLCADPEFTADERLFRELWKKYFTRISVEERENPRLQKQNVPLKYRKHLVEMEE